MSRILIVDDEPDIAATLAGVLEDEGYQVDTAANGREGLEKIRAEPPDLVLLDVMMPIMDGSEVLERLRGNPGTSGVRVVIMTAGGMAREDFDCDAFLGKPFHLDAVLDVVERLVGAPSAGRAQ